VIGLVKRSRLRGMARAATTNDRTDGIRRLIQAPDAELLSRGVTAVTGS
jgi:hypothetical protein